MGSSAKEKFQLIFEARESASAKIKQLNKELANLGGPQMVKSQNQIKKLNRQISQLSGQATKSRGIFTRFTQGIATGNLIANAVTSALGLLTKGVKELGNAVMVSANVEELAGVLNFVGQRAGYSSEEIKGYTMALRKSGIAQKEANQALLRAVQGSIAFTDAVKLGRIAQDSAVIGQMNSSEAYQTLIDAVVKGRVVMLKSLGIQGTFEQSYKDMAKTLGKASAHLTQAEKRQARLNLVFKGGEVIAGAYETAMGSASKQLRSMDRLIQDLQVAVGQYFVPALSVLVKELSNVTKAMTAGFGGESKQNVDEMARSIGMLTTGIIATTKVIFNFGQIAIDVISMAVIAPLETALTSVLALKTVLSDPFNMDAWSQAGEVMGAALDGFATDWSDIKTNVADVGNAVVDLSVAMAFLSAPKDIPIIEPIQNEVDQLVEKVIPEAIIAWETLYDEFGNNILDEAKITSIGIDEVLSTTSKSSRSLMGKVSQFSANMISNMVDQFMSGKANIGEIFKGMAMDFMSFFIKQALAMLLNTFLPGIGSILGGMFDTPVNDKMASDQGKDFMSWFQRGAMAQATGSTSLAVGLTQNTSSIAPVSPVGGSGGGGMIMMNVTVSGNVLSSDYIEEQIAPALQRLADDGRTQLAVIGENNTGGRDVIIR